MFRTNTWASGTIRGKQIAEWLGAMVDVVPAPENCIVVVVKMFIADINDTLGHVKSVWIDVVDGLGLIDFLFLNPKLKGIAIGKLAYEFISNRIDNPLVIIPEHHCNFENAVREDREVRTIGAICYPGNFDLNPGIMKDEFNKLGFEFKLVTSFDDRKEIVDFYKSIDIQLCFRKWRGLGKREPPELKNPLKLGNAGSFKIPTVAYPEPCFLRDFGKDTFVHARNFNEIMTGCQRLRDDKAFYEDVSSKAFERAKDFHIDKIAPMYKELY